MLGMNKSIFRRLLISYMLTIILGIGIVGILMFYFTNSYITNAKQEELLRQGRTVNANIQGTMFIGEDKQETLEFLDHSFDARIWIFNKEGKIIATSTRDEVSIGKAVASSIVERVLVGENVVSRLRFEGLAEPMLSVVVPWGKQDHVYGGIVLHAPLRGLNNIIGKIRETILWATLFGILFSTAMVSYLSWSISRPLQQIDRTAARLAMGDVAERIHIKSEDEIGDLATTINMMATKLEKIEVERQRIDKIRSDFLANISHELRTPLTTMQGFLEALQDGLIEDEGRQRYYDVMYDETTHMNRLVDDLMDLIKLENKEITLSRYQIDPKSILEKEKFKFDREAAEKNVEIDLVIKEPLPKVFIDPIRFEQIINNILKNAVKFTEDGEISITAEAEDHYLLLSVADTGIGISDPDQELIWERFYKVDRGRSRKNKGTGLGLAIVKKLVELHDGRITVQSEIGVGTMFKIWIPSVVKGR
uniref:histidine kinase n=2 Tax=Anaerobacillus isosaccharinicus TaxID=1532552 RepID=A0A1S2L5G6_9BACI|nr:ATP-binding protein [Anaerobacillus isosaccharinicus]MBA5588724.1 HAMP domain-containing protein [Anaerobacillus isosaccharinicus]QOY37876.1 HAMP domain-containing protein [Anaerobacillus isosaccharinicus]